MTNRQDIPVKRGATIAMDFLCINYFLFSLDDDDDDENKRFAVNIEGKHLFTVEFGAKKLILHKQQEST